MAAKASSDPKEKTSLAAVSESRLACSGDSHAGLPVTIPVAVSDAASSGGDAEIDEDRSALAHDHVRRFDVAVGDAVDLEDGQRLRQTAREFPTSAVDSADPRSPRRRAGSDRGCTRWPATPAFRRCPRPEIG